jgi:nicotinamidase-related amidase
MSDEKSDIKLDTRRTAIVVIDLQKGIAGMPGGAPHAKPAIIANAARLLAAARAAGAQPVLVHVGGSPDGADRLHTPTDQPMRSLGALPPDWIEFIPELNQQPTDIVILKRQWGAFYGTDLDLQLRRRNLSTSSSAVSPPRPAWRAPRATPMSEATNSSLPKTP